jgi:hypothetical protein
MLNFLHFDEVEIFLSFAEALSCHEARAKRSFGSECNEQASAVVNFFGNTTMQ